MRTWPFLYDTSTGGEAPRWSMRRATLLWFAFALFPFRAPAAGADLTTLLAKLGGLPQSPEAAFPALEQVKLPGITLDRIRSADSAYRVAFLSGVRSAREEATRRLAEFQHRAAGLEELRREFRDLSIRNRAYCDRVYATQGL